MRIAAFRLVSEGPDARRVGLVVGDSSKWWIHPFPDGTDLVELLAAEPWRA